MQTKMKKYSILGQTNQNFATKIWSIYKSYKSPGEIFIFKLLWNDFKLSFDLVS